MRIPRPSLFRLSIAALALGGGLAAGPTAAQQASPFSVEDTAPVCSNTATGTFCTYEVGPVPAGKRWQLYMVACRNNLINSAATEIASLKITGPNGGVLFDFPILPVKLTSNGFTISQLISVPAVANRKVQVTITSFNGVMVANGLGTFCTLSGDQITP